MPAMRVILVDPALPFVPARPDPFVAAMFALYAVPGLGRMMMDHRHQRAPEAVVAELFSLCCADSSRVPADVVALHVEVARQRSPFTGVGRDYAAAARSVAATAGYGSGHAYRQGIRSITCPVLLLTATGTGWCRWRRPARRLAPIRPGHWSCCPAPVMRLSWKRRGNARR
jgi:hypothetical protein